ncbi:MAG: Asp-tRNA(Asn)/Glu-tRNA(Gln) amidotransferase subunit GatC [Aquificaceae bacterium]|jgi:aspartyl-tRNA(Asn)/glutamyl-tRNA(Gln) amidotransferase subunit C|uniref:Asp-tRNA(Asn)/Glu-tRNA(Gln) amidotransferase subunit GatC n=1 Tax=Hydrogenobacter sp. Uz 6-8 TaxID=3384828 RepID=UPI0030B0E7E8
MVEKVAHLARLRLTEEEKEYFEKQLKSILHFVEQLQEVDTWQVESFTSHFDETPMREDEPSRDFEPYLILEKAPEGEGGFFVVPRVVEY